VTLFGWLCVSDVVKEHVDVVYKCGQSEEWQALCFFETVGQTNLMAATQSSRPEPSTALL
jgi:hypothetical protein